jgi:hypothetical protein
MRSPRLFGAALVAFMAGAAVHLPTAAAQARESAVWFGVTLPPGFEADVPTVILGTDYGPRPAAVPPGEESFASLKGDAIHRDLETIVGFSMWSRKTKEVGSGQLWGRITGLASGERTMDWVERRFREAGVPRVERQWFDQTPNTSLWLPLSWEVRLHADPAFGAGSQDVILESAMLPAAPSCLEKDWTRRSSSSARPGPPSCSTSMSAGRSPCSTSPRRVICSSSAARRAPRPNC